MLLSDIPKIRLANLLLSLTKLDKAEDVVKYLGAMQSQDYMGAKWALAQRLNKSANDKIDADFNSGRILRTHALRPTWHFVAPGDLKWITKLNAPQVKKIMSYYYKQLDITASVINKSNTIIAAALKNKNFLTRTEIEHKLAEGGIKAHGQKLGHIVGEAELDLIICSGPRKGKQFTYALVDEVTPKTKDLSREESISKLAELFFKTRGPATVKDFSKWSGLPMVDSKKGLESVKSKFKSEIIEGKEYWFSPQSLHSTFNTPIALLLPNYDEYISSYSDYSVISTPQTQKNLDKIGNALFWNHIIINGVVAGSWRRTVKLKVAEIELALLKDLSAEEKLELKKQAEKYAQFFNLKLSLKGL